jgi:hypothetical protein
VRPEARLLRGGAASLALGRLPSFAHRPRLEDAGNPVEPKDDEARGLLSRLTLRTALEGFPDSAGAVRHTDIGLAICPEFVSVHRYRLIRRSPSLQYVRPRRPTN